MRRVLVSLGVLAAFALSIAAALTSGSEEISIGDAVDVLLYHAGLGTGTPPERVADLIVWHLRLPRVLLAMIVGGGLAVVGVAIQALVRNPLAEPYILGISSGASAGASMFYLGFLPPLVSQAISMPLAAFVGASASIVLVFLVARSGLTVSVTRLLLAGVSVSSLMAAITSFVTLTSPSPLKLQAVLFWLMGSLSATQWATIPLPLIVTTVGLALLLGFSRTLDTLLIGEEPARSLGVSVESVKRILVFLVAVVTGTLVAFSGTIGFVGLIIPHAARAVVGITHRRLLAASFVAGALFLLWADLAARSILSPQEIPIGILTAICGVPFFLVVLKRRQYQFG